jgi:hypothetical protein
MQLNRKNEETTATNEKILFSRELHSVASAMCYSIIKSYEKFKIKAQDTSND